METAFSSYASPVSSFVRGQSLRAPRCNVLVSRTPVTRRRPTTMRVYDVEIDFHGKTYAIPIDENQTLLEGIEAFGLTVPYSCRAGVCTTCAAKIMSGKVDLGEIAMMDDLKDEGYVLTCSGMPRSEGIKLEMNHFDDVYEKQYGQYEKLNQK